MKNLIVTSRLALVLAFATLVSVSTATAGNHIPKAEIVVVRQGENERFVVRPDDSGRFTFTSLPAGAYTMSISESSFNKAIVSAGAQGSAAADYYLKLTAARAPMNPVSVRRFFAGIPITVGSDGLISGSISYSSNNVTSPRDAASGMASGK